VKQFLIALDQLINTLLGGYADETLSARFWRTKHPAYHWVDKLFFWDHKGLQGHCELSFESEVMRRQLPVEYRNIKPETP